MAISRASSRLAWAILSLAAGSAWSRESATPAQCRALASQPPLSNDIANVARHSDDAKAQMALADAWSDAGCYNDAVTALQNAVVINPGVVELQTRLRVAKSLVGEERFFDDLDRADRQAKIKRDAFRCDSLGDLDACSEAVHLQPGEAPPLVALGDALVRARRPSEALQQYRRAEISTGDKQALVQKIHVAESALAVVPSDEPAGAKAAVVGNAAGAGDAAGPVSAAATADASGTGADSRVARSSSKNASRRYSNETAQGQAH